MVGHADDPRRRAHRPAPRRGAYRRRPSCRRHRGAVRRRVGRPVVRPRSRRRRGAGASRQSGRASRNSPLVGPHPGAGGQRIDPGRALRDRSADRGRLLLRLRAARAAVDRRPAEDRAAHAGARATRSALRARGAVARRRARAVRRAAVQARDHRVARRERGRDRGHRERVPERRLVGPVSRAARSVDRAARRVQADEGRRRILARRRDPADASTDLRDRMADRGGPRRVPHPPRGGRAARPPTARQGARSVQLSGRARCGPRRVASARRDLP